MISLPSLAGLLLALSPVSPHGGVYRGPGSTVPPGGGGGGPSTPLGPGGAAVTDWDVWWTFNRDPYLRLKEAIHSPSASTGNDDFFLGFGQVKRDTETFPDEQDLRSEVVPALLAATSGTKNQDLITAGVMALAKVGATLGSDAELETAIARFLAHPNQEIAETAAVALGILGHETAALKLSALLGDTAAGRELVQRKEVPYRTRSFAAYGLALLGAQSERTDVRQFAIFHLATTLEREGTATRDLATACVIGIGLVPLDVASGAWPAPDEGAPPDGASRESQIAWLLHWFSTTRKSDTVRLHAPVALARLCAGAGETPRRATAAVLLAALANDKAENREVQRAAVIALGRLGDDDGDDVDGRIRDRLRKLHGSKDAMSRDLARIALARCATRPGAGREPGVALEPVQRWLIKDLASGRSTSRPWTALSLGILAWRRAETGREVPGSVHYALRESLRSTKSPRDAGALCAAAGLARDPQVVADLIGRVEGGADDSVKAQAAVALGMIGAAEAVPALRALLQGATNRPAVLREAATGLALLGDRGALPELFSALREAKTLPTQSALAFAIGRIGDARSLPPLLEMLRDEQLPEATRAFAAAALGVVAHDEWLPWNSRIAVDLYYGQPPGTLTDGARGVLDLL